MAVIINELEVVLEPPPGKAQPGGGITPQEPAKLNPIDLLTVTERDQLNQLRLRAH
jgi:hypothetical protein